MKHKQNTKKSFRSKKTRKNTEELNQYPFDENSTSPEMLHKKFQISSDTFSSNNKLVFHGQQTQSSSFGITMRDLPNSPDLEYIQSTMIPIEDLEKLSQVKSRTDNGYFSTMPKGNNETILENPSEENRNSTDSVSNLKIRPSIKSLLNTKMVHRHAKSAKYFHKIIHKKMDKNKNQLDNTVISEKRLTNVVLEREKIFIPKDDI
jgi:hypothetical protein